MTLTTRALRYLAPLLTLLWLTPSIAQQALPEQDSLTGRLNNADQELTYTFSASTGDTVALKMVDLEGDNPNSAGDISPYLLMYDPSGALLASDRNRSVAEIVNRTIPLTGEYTVVATNYSAIRSAGAGPFELHFARAPGTGEHGTLPSGGKVSEALTKGDIDTYTFFAETGHTVSLKLVDLEGNDPDAAGNFSPYLLMYDPTGALVASDNNRSVAEIINRTLPLTGSYTVVATNYSSIASDQIGPYDLHFARTPSAGEHGGLTNGDKITQALTLGDIDSYTFYAATGSTVSLTLADLNGQNPDAAGNFSPHLLMYDPNGKLVSADRNRAVAEIINQTLDLSGTYTVVATNYSAITSDRTGPYDLHFALTPGAGEYGKLHANRSVAGSLTLGDIDSYTFYAESGNTVTLKMRDLEGDNPNASGNLSPYLLMYDPEGSLVTSDRNRSLAEIVSRRLPQTGFYTVIATNYSAISSERIGPYSLDFSIAPQRQRPQAPIVRAPSGTGNATAPTLAWDSVGDALWYRVWIQDTADNVILQRWYSSKAAGCVTAGTQCAVTSPVALSGTLRLWVHSWNSAGSSNWSAATTFSVSQALPLAPALTAPMGNAPLPTPVYQWNRLGNASWYYVSIADDRGERVGQWVSAGAAGCAATGTACTYRFNANVIGTVAWSVRGWNSNGSGLSSPVSQFISE